MLELIVAFLVLFPAATLVAQASPSTAAPQPAPTATDYPFIGRTRSQRYCSLETDRINGGITVTLTNDKLIAAGIGRLRGADLDRPELTVIDREKTMRDLRYVAAAIQTNLRAGDAEIADIRALSVKEPDAVRSRELKLVADQLDDAMTRQRSVGSDLAKMLTIVEGRYAGAQGGHAAAGVMPETNQVRVNDGIESIDQRAQRDPLNQLFSNVADDFADRTVAIGKSEDAAAVHVPKAVTGC